MVGVRPSAAIAAPTVAPVVVITRGATVPVCSVIAPAVMVLGTDVVTPAILASKVPTVSEMSMLVPVVPAGEPVFTKVNVLPLTTIVSPAATGAANEFGVTPESSVVASIATPVGGPLREAAAPINVASEAAVAGVPTGNGLAVKSVGFKPPAANSVPASAVGLTAVFGVVGRLAAY